MLKTYIFPPPGSVFKTFKRQEKLFNFFSPWYGCLFFIHVYHSIWKSLIAGEVCVEFKRALLSFSYYTSGLFKYLAIWNGFFMGMSCKKSSQIIMSLIAIYLIPTTHIPSLSLNWLKKLRYQLSPDNRSFEIHPTPEIETKMIFSGIIL